MKSVRLVFGVLQETPFLMLECSQPSGQEEPVQFYRKRGGFTLAEIMIVVAIIALLLAIAVPAFLRARKRSQASTILNDLRLIDSAVDQYALEYSKPTGSAVGVADWTSYLKNGTLLYNTGNDIFGDSFGTQTVDAVPKVPAAAFSTLSDVAPSSFWSPYY
jgi:prepilin-type N-terminal cleavage/methylation domain-containing protein